MTLYELDRAMNDLMEKYDWHDTNEQEEQFLQNIAKDIVELLIEHEAADQVKSLFN